jgi:hypothetical protein
VQNDQQEKVAASFEYNDSQFYSVLSLEINLRVYKPDHVKDICTREGQKQDEVGNKNMGIGLHL